MPIDKSRPEDALDAAHEEAIARLRDLVAQAVWWVKPVEIAAVIDELCAQIMFAVRRGETVTLPNVGTLRRLDLHSGPVVRFAAVPRLFEPPPQATPCP